MADPSIEVPLPPSVEAMLLKICHAQSQQPANIAARRELASLGEQMSLRILKDISASTIRKTLSAFVVYMARKKAFLILSYLRGKRPEDFMTEQEILSWKDLPMKRFESKVWDAYGHRCCDETDRREYSDWDSGKTYLYKCHVYADGSYIFKGPYLNTTRTHLQRELGDDNVLIVKFAEEANDVYIKIANEGILVGPRRYRFFVFKDGGKEVKNDPTSSSVNCYFVRMESIALWDEGTPKKTVHEARCHFMHVHMVPSMAKYMARFSLVLSTTIKLKVDFASLCIETIEDIPCHDENDCRVLSEDGKPLIHTDGTGYISEDLALKCPKDFYNAKYINDENFKRFLDCVNNEEGSLGLRVSEARTREPPLLMQVRLFNNGCAVKGTLLINKKLPPRTIQVRPSMVKVETDSKLLGTTRNSLEIVRVSNRPKEAFLSKNLIALLSYGGVPKEYFLEILTNALQDTQNVYFNKRAALRVALNHGEIDDDFMATRMILSGIPLNEPCLQHRLSGLATKERKGLKGGKLPISESFYLMGTVDPTGVLKHDQVSVILDHGPLLGKARDLWPAKLQMVILMVTCTGSPETLSCWIVSRHVNLGNERSILHQMHITKSPASFQLRNWKNELFRMFLSTRFQPSDNAGVAANSWLAFMDRLLILGDASAGEKACMKDTMLKLVDLYYDALDAPKSGKRVEVPNEYKAEKYPHYMERKEKSYKSTSVLGLIYDKVNSFESEDMTVKEVWKLPSFDVEIPEACLQLWKERYDEYRSEMKKALKTDSESKNDFANEVIKKYKRLLYDAEELEESEKKEEEIFNEALAIYNVTYDYAMGIQDVGKCRYAWKVAGSALCKLYVKKQREKIIVCSQSVLRELFK
ncbi:hypothetical protein F0562_009585 [Nyssa sinensis]|uniref:RNA-dependent RNA polymerase n=1 Tax=Nyssa sinensis TaxID=561372 RepID=A0A5J5A0C2_9ASTE|nr:hypothetical protein F0562_009585 [Nyssa sinensis]